MMAPLTGTTAQAFSMLMDSHAHAWTKHNLGPQLAMTSYICRIYHEFGLHVQSADGNGGRKVTTSRANWTENNAVPENTILPPVAPKFSGLRWS